MTSTTAIVQVRAQDQRAVEGIQRDSGANVTLEVIWGKCVQDGMAALNWVSTAPCPTNPRGNKKELIRPVGSLIGNNIEP